jgi:hypothetical protein
LEIERLRAALLTARGYAAEIEADAGTSLQSLRASLIQEVVDRTLGTYPPVPGDRTEWAHAKDDQLYHSVTFGPGPNIHEAPAACGKVARFWPRIGIRMEDRQCEACLTERVRLEG